MVILRVDESLYFVNARFLEDLIQSRVTDGCEVRNVVLMFSAVNAVDYSALESLEAINARLKDMLDHLNGGVEADADMGDPGAAKPIDERKKDKRDHRRADAEKA